MELPKYFIRNLQKKDIPKLLDHFKEMKYDINKHSVHTWQEFDPDAIQVAVTFEGELLGVCASIFYGKDYAHLGLYVVRDQYRGKGVGSKLFKVCYDRIGNCNASLTVYVDSKYLNLYVEKGSFPIVEKEYKLYFHSTEVEIDVSPLKENAKGIKIKQMTDNALQQVLNYDRSLMPIMERDKLIKLVLNEKDSLALLAEENNKCVGYGAIKLTSEGYNHLGPLYADSQDVAEALIFNLIKRFSQGKRLLILSMSNNQAAQNIIKKLNIPSVNEVIICYKHAKCSFNTQKVYFALHASFTLF